MSKLKRIGLIGLMFLLVGMIAPAFGWDWTQVEGEGEIQAVRSHGNDNVGGTAFLDASAQFSAISFHHASGSLELDGCLMGNSFQSSNFGLSWNLGSITSNANARGLLTDVETNGLIGQANWVSVGSFTNYAAGQNFTLAEYEIERSRWGLSSVEGGGLVSGLTFAFVTDNPSQKESFVNTNGFSLSWVRGSGCGDPIVLGNGSIQLQSYLVKPGMAAVASGSGSACYFASGPHFASGALNISGHTQINAIPNGLQISSSVKAKSSATSR